jgi:mRNA-degrading endonuclease RelE of RelBE toxin-antitoxin system
MIEIKYSKTFKKEFKTLRKRFRKIDIDIKNLILELKNNPKIGTSLYSNLYKIRLQNSSIPIGKSGGFRVITYLVLNDIVYLVSIYSKTDKDNITENDINDIIKGLLDER